MYPGSSANNALIQNNFKIGLSTMTSGASTNTVTPAWYSIVLKAEILIQQAVIVIVYNGGAYSRNLDVYATDRYGVETICGSLADPNGGTNPEVACNRPAISIKI